MRKAKLCCAYALSALLAVGGVMPVYAAGSLSLTQSADSFTSDGDQVYTVSYDGDEPGSTGSASLELEFGSGFQPGTVSIGDWSGTDGDIDVTICYYDSNDEEAEQKASYNEGDSFNASSEVDGTVYKITFETDGGMDNADFSDVKVSGAIDVSETGGTLKTSASYYWTDSDGEKEKLADASASASCTYYSVGTPTLTASASTVGYLSSLDLGVSGISGSGSEAPDSYVVTVNLPQRLFVDGITLPGFDHASYQLYVDGKEQDTTSSARIYINSRVSTVTLHITADGKSFSQSGEMVIETRNATNTAGDETLSVNVKAVYGDGLTAEVSSAPCTVQFVETLVPTDPDDPGSSDTGNSGSGGTSSEGSGSTGNGSAGGNTSSGTSGNDSDEITGTITGSEESETTPSDTESSKASIIDSLNLIGLKVSVDEDTGLNVSLASGSNTSSLQPSLSERLQTTSVYDFTASASGGQTSTSDSDGDSAFDLDTETEESDAPAEEIEKTTKEKAADKLDDLSSNSFVWVMLIVVLIIAAAAAIIFAVFRQKKTDGQEADLPEEPDDQ